MSSTLGIGLTTKELVTKRKHLNESVEDLNNKLNELYRKIVNENFEVVKKFLEENNLELSEEEFIKIKFYIEEEGNIEVFSKEIQELDEQIKNFELKYLDDFRKNVNKMAILEKKLEIYNMAKDYYIDNSCKRIGWLSDIIKKIKNTDLEFEVILSAKDIEKIIEEINKINKWSYYEDEEKEIIEPELKKEIINSLLKIKSFLIDEEIVCIAKIF